MAEKRCRYEKWLNENTTDLTGKTVGITGSTGGLGKELCQYLARCGASLILLDRNSKRSEEHANELKEKFVGISVETVPLSLESLESADFAVKKLIEMNVDIIIHNAGAYSIPRHKCDSGFDNVFQINFATPYYMTKQLLPHLRERSGKVVAVGSIAHNYSKTDTSDIDFSTRKASSKVYGNSKRILMFSLCKLFENETNVSLSVTHPGIAFTNITAHYPKLIFAVIKHPMKVIFMKPAKAALSILKGVFCSTKNCCWIGPRLFDVWGMPKKKILKTATADEIDSIFEIAENVYQKCVETLK